MGCRAIENWSLCSLVGAYIDLAIAALLLYGATLAFLASNLLALLGLSLPCPQFGFFGRLSPCIHRRLLVDLPADTIAAVHSSLLTRFPFDSLTSSPAGRRLLSDDDDNSSAATLADESCASFSHHLALPGPPPAAPGSETSSADSKSEIQTTSLRRRRRRSSSASAQGAVAIPPPTLWSVERSDDSAGETSAESSPAPPIDGTPEEEDALLPGAREAVTIRELEWALVEEQAARARLDRELEEERNAAATAADESMAMILRLQEEKAAIEMESRQYHRMIDEKSAFDEEEMEILKEIVVRREMEKRSLEKELEGYRQMMVPGWRGEKPLEEDPLHLLEHPPGCFAQDLMEDPVLMLHQIYESLGEKGTEDSKKQFGNMLLPLDLAEDAVSPYRGGDIMQVHSSEKHQLDVVDSKTESNLDFQEKGMLNMEVCSSSIQGKMTSSGESSSLYNEFQGLTFHQENSDILSKEDSVIVKNTEARVPILDLYRENVQDAAQKVSDSPQLEAESRILDVYVIDDRDRLNLCDGGKEKEIDFSHKFASDIYGQASPAVESSGSSKVGLLYSNQDTSWGRPEQNVSRSCSDMTRPPQPVDNLSDTSSSSGLKRRSMSAVDGERSKLEIEVEILRKKLKVIQQERENLRFTKEHAERESFQMHILEEIARQLQEIRKLTESGKSECHASLPLPSSKASTKKRRCRSASQGLLDCT